MHNPDLYTNPTLDHPGNTVRIIIEYCRACMHASLPTQTSTQYIVMHPSTPQFHRRIGIEYTNLKLIKIIIEPH